MSCDSPPLTPFQPARRRHTEIESIMGKRTYTALSMCIERRGARAREREANRRRRKDVHRQHYGCEAKEVGGDTCARMDDRGGGVGGGRGCATQLG